MNDRRPSAPAWTADLDRVVRESLEGLVSYVFGGLWTGRREREVVSLYAIGYLIPSCRPGSFLSDPTQIGIEVAVPQIERETHSRMSGRAGAKAQVCKDVVIWPTPRLTCWDATGRPTVYPSAVMEWKFGESRISSWDTGWLQEYSSGVQEFVGYAACLDRQARSFRFSCSRFYRGNREDRWLEIS